MAKWIEAMIGGVILMMLMGGRASSGKVVMMTVMWMIGLKKSIFSVGTQYSRRFPIVMVVWTMMLFMMMPIFAMMMAIVMLMMIKMMMKCVSPTWIWELVGWKTSVRGGIHTSRWERGDARVTLGGGFCFHQFEGGGSSSIVEFVLKQE